jgi:integrase/recombinase XerD
MDVASAIMDYLASIKHLSKRTQAGYKQRLGVFSEWCSGQGIPLEQVNNKTVQRFLEWLRMNHKPRKSGKGELSTHTTAGYVRALWTLLYWCLDDEEYSQYVKMQVVKGIKMPRLEQTVKGVFTDEELEALFAACSHPNKPHEYQLRDAAILSLLLDCGLRSAELRSLTIGNIALDADDAYISVHGKNNKWRELPLGTRARRSLGRYLRQYRHGAAKSEPVFLSRHGGQLAHESLKDILLRLKAVSGLPADVAVNPHRFRHSYSARFMANGGDVYDLSRMLGHSSVAITEGYLKSLSASAVRKRRDRPSVLDQL